MGEELLDNFMHEVEVVYRDESYRVRDNGAILRRRRPEGRRRPLDETWTFGTKEPSTGYMAIGHHKVHRIVATAFHLQPTPKHIVDHIDTNRANNRAENLRWLTRLENVLANPVTRRRVELAYGSLQAFFENPSAVRVHVQELSWMRTVSKAEADQAYANLLRWAESAHIPKGGSLGEWVFQPDPIRVLQADPVVDTPSLTGIATQRRWKTPSEFPACPVTIGPSALVDYAKALPQAAVFARNAFGESLAETVGTSDVVLAVMTRTSPPSVKDWALTKVTVENSSFVHESMGRFFTRDGALNAFNELLGIDAPHLETVDDFS